MPSVITDPQAYAKAIMERRRLLQMAQSGAPFDTGQMSPFMQGIIGKTDAPPNAGIQLPTVRGLADTLIPQSMRPPVGVSPSDNYPDPRIEAYRNKSQSGGNLDPAQAAADGFNIPDYISPAQTVGGSGTYMSKVMDQPSDAQVAGGSGNYMSRVGQSPDVAASGSVPVQDDSIFSFFGKPEATDAMAAFGAGMLRGKNFADGLANATEGVNNVAKQYRPLTEQELLRMRQLADVQKKISGDQYSPGQVGYAPGHGYITTRFNKSAGVTEYQLRDGSITTVAPPGFRQRTDSNEGENQTFDAKAFNDQYNNYEASKNNYNQYSEMVKLAPDISAGGDMFNTFARNMNQLTGISFSGNLSKQEYFDKLNNSAQLEGAQSQKGLGQFTEMERRIVASSLPNISTQQATIIKVGTRLALQQDIKNKIVERWMNMTEEEQAAAGGFRKFRSNQIKDFYDNYESLYEQKLQELTGSMSNGSSNQSGGSANISEADKISGYTP